MYFDPLTTWLVVLLADGIILGNEQGSDYKTRLYYEKKAEETNVLLNGDLRRLLGTYSHLADFQVREIRHFLECYRKRFEYRYGAMKLDHDVQERILTLFEKYVNEHQEIIKKHEETYNKKIATGQSVSYTERRINEEKTELAFCQQVLIAVEEQRRNKQELSKKQNESQGDSSASGCSCSLVITLLIVFIVVLVIAALN